MRAIHNLPIRLTRRHLHLANLLAAHILLFAFAGYTAFLLRFEFSIPSNQLANLAYALPIWLTLKSLSFHVAGLYHSSWRFLSLPEATRLGLANTAGAAASALVIAAMGPRSFPRSIYFMDFLLCLVMTGY